MRFSKFNDKSFSDRLDVYMTDELRKIFKSKLDIESLEKMDIKFIENYIRKKKL